jgi:hypothetical protein
LTKEHRSGLDYVGGKHALLDKARVGYPMLSSFETALDSAASPAPLLPLTHGTTLSVLEAIVTCTIAGTPVQLEPRLCSVFNHPLIYTFYARPAYMKAGDDYVNDPAFLPIFLVIRGDVLSDSVMIHPFDTGRFALYPFSALTNMGDYILQSGSVSIGRLIATFYASAVEYYWIHPKTKTLPHGTPPTIEGYYNMLHAPHPRPEDGRESSIEIAFDQPIPLAGNLRLAVVPRAIGGMRDLHSAFTALGCDDVSYYDWRGRFRPSDFRNHLWQKISDHLSLGY